jgi:hypothetical protein
MFVGNGLVQRRLAGLADDYNTGGISPDQFAVNIPQLTVTLPTLAPAYSDTSTYTGLPVWLELGVFGLVGYYLFRFVSETTQRVRSGVRAARGARRK